MQRRTLLKYAAMAGTTGVLRQSAAALRVGEALNKIPIIDAHIHLFDPTRPGGVPWPEKTDTVLNKPALPDRYVSTAAQFGVVGAIAIEASPLATDNDWLLRVAGDHPIIVGVVGDMIPGTPTYPADLDRLHANPLFLGFRYGNLWDRNLLIDMEKPGFIDGLKTLAQSGLVLECANPDSDLVLAISRIADRIPNLRMVIDHLPHATLPVQSATLDAYWSHLRHLAQNPNIYAKLSEIPVLIDGRLQTDVSYYQKGIDALWNTFGEDHIFFGSDWPNSDHVASYADTFKLVTTYVSSKSVSVREKFFWKNSIAAYRWKKRTADQPSL